MPASFEGRSRVVNLAYRVITDFVLPLRDIPDAEIYAMLGAAFYRKAAESAEEPKKTNGEERPDLPGHLLYMPPSDD